MTYVVKWHPQAFKVLSKLPKELLQRILTKFDAVAQEPFRYLEHFEGEGIYKLRIGDYRALIQADFQNKLLLVKVFDQRGNVYKK